MLVENHLPKESNPLSKDEVALKEELESHVRTLALTFGQRNIMNPGSLFRCLGFIKKFWDDCGYKVHSQDYLAYEDIFTNLWVEIPGSKHPEEIVILGAHYDTFPGTPGADDNGTALAGLLAVSKMLAGARSERTLRFVAFANEEPPYFMTDLMGSYVYARACKERQEDIKVMICLEMLGYFSDEPGSQRVTYDLLPEEGNFIALAGNVESKAEILRAGSAFQAVTDFPLSLAAVPESMVPAIGYSDHWSFWQCGWPAFMVTDTGPLRNPHYHLPSDLPETIDFEALTRVVTGVRAIVESFSRKQPL